MHQLITKTVVTLAATMFMCGCDDDCVEVDTSCSPLYEPTFDNIYTNTLSVSCSVGNGTCHTSDGQATAGNLAFTSADDAYAMLVNGRVETGDAACSLLVLRIEADDSDVMPPGSPLSEAERCAITQWVANGAAR